MHLKCSSAVLHQIHCEINCSRHLLEMQAAADDHNNPIQGDVRKTSNNLRHSLAQ